MIAIILTVIVIVAAFNVVSTLMMMIHDKTKEISILKAMGFRPGQGFRLFSIIGLGMGAVGTAFGILLRAGDQSCARRPRISSSFRPTFTTSVSCPWWYVGRRSG